MKVNSPRKHVNILGIEVDSTSKETVLREIQLKLKNGQKFYIVTPNPEQILMAQEDEQYKEILNSADIAIPDGVGLVAAAKFFSLPRPKNFIKRALILSVQGLGVGFSTLFDRKWIETELELIKGREFFVELIKLANKKGWRVVLVGDGFQSAQKAARKLRQNFINLNIIGVTGPDLKNNGSLRTDKEKAVEEKALKQINKIKPDLLFIGFRSPVQEKWLYRWFKDMDFKCAMVVGGTFDYASGKKQTPPFWIADLGLEWLWRVFIGDQKFKRVIKAFPEFPLRIFWQKFVSEHK